MSERPTPFSHPHGADDPEGEAELRALLEKKRAAEAAAARKPEGPPKPAPETAEKPAEHAREAQEDAQPGTQPGAQPGAQQEAQQDARPEPSAPSSGEAWRGQAVDAGAETGEAESEKTMEDNLRTALAHKRATSVEVSDVEDPYGDDPIAKRYLKPIQKYLDRDDIADIKEIVINQPQEVGLEYADGHWDWIEDKELTQAVLDDAARMLANRSGQLFHPGNPILSVKMPGGHRVQIVAGFNAPSGFLMNIRLQRKEKFSLDDFDMPADELEAVKNAVRNRQTMLISGGTSTGKTSFMNALIPFIPEDERLVTLEDVPELRLPHKNWCQMLFAGNDTAMGDQGIIELLNATLRMRPDRIILGEIRKENAFAFASAINTGHEGSMATIHANNPRMAIDAVINRVLMNGDLPESAISVLRRQLIDDIQAVVQLTRKGKRVQARFFELEDEADLKKAEAETPVVG